MTATVATDANPVESLTERIFGEGIAAFHQLSLYLGVRLGLFKGLADAPGSTARELAAATSTDERYVIEWAQAETIAGLLEADGTDYSTAHFTLAPGVIEALVDEVHPSYVGGIPAAVAAIGTAAPALLEAYRSGAGIPMSAYGPEVVLAQAAFNRPAYANELVQSWLPQMGDIHTRLLDTSRPARVADIGCGAGWSAIELAKALPHITVDGYDADTDSIIEARKHAANEGVADRVTFHVVDASATTYGSGDYDAIFFFECLHDIGRPVEALAAARAAVAVDGAVVVMDERTADHPQVGDRIEMFFAFASVTWCLPQSRVTPDCEAPGTLMRPATLESFARRAAWTGYEVQPIEHPVWRFYRLVP